MIMPIQNYSFKKKYQSKKKKDSSLGTLKMIEKVDRQLNLHEKQPKKQLEPCHSVSIAMIRCFETIKDIVLFIEDKTEHTAFEGHDMIQRFVCSLYQQPYPSEKLPSYTLGKVSSSDSKNYENWIYDLVDKYIYDHPEGIHYGLEKMNKIVLECLTFVEHYTETHDDFSNFSRGYSSEALANYICSKFLLKAEHYKEKVKTVLVEEKLGFKPFNELRFFSKIPHKKPENLIQSSRYLF
jgi:hypothetical protein